LLAFSLSGLSAYAIVASLVAAPLPAYISPHAMEVLRPEQIGPLAVAFLGHLACATICGGGAGYAIRALARLTSLSVYFSAWNHFINSCSKGRWVTIGLTNGQVYAGYIDKADLSVAASERDIILREPALYDEAARAYRMTSYQTMFLLGSTIVSIAAIMDTQDDVRITSRRKDLFGEETKSAQ
jgi:hypothetical protein